MTTNVQRIELDADSSNATIEAAILVELATIDAATGTIVGYNEFFNIGLDKIDITFIYTTP